MSDTEGTTDTTNQQNILLVISIDGSDETENSFKEYVAMKWTKDIIKRGAYLTKANIFSVLRRLLEAFKEKSHETLISQILLADENDEKDVDSDDEDASDKETPYEKDPLLSTSDRIDTDKEREILDLIDYCNREHKRFYPKAFDFDPTRPELRIAIDDVLDHTGVLRQQLWSHISDIRLSQDDNEYIIKRDVQKKRRLDRRDPPKPCYYASQEYAASAIIKRIRFILDYYHKKRQLESFSEFDFRIYTARSNMLEEQTLSRLCDRRAKCFSEEDYADEIILREKAKQRVRKYAITKHTDFELETLEHDVLNNPDKLFLIVADEAHWGISNSTHLHSIGANHKLINAWDHMKHPNVVVLLVTATPWNLLTENSRLPVVNVAEASDDGRFIVVDTGQYDLRHKKLIDQEGKDVTNEVGSVKELHVFKWTENYEIYFKKGLVLSLRVPQRSQEDSIWLTVDKGTSETNFYSVTGANDAEQATKFLLKGTNGEVTITTEDELLVLTAEASNVGFTKRDSDQIKPSSRLFKVRMEHGENVIELESVSTGAKLSHLTYVYKSGEVELGPNPAANSKMAVDRTYCFLIDSQKGFDEIEAGPQYLSLNFYYNSIRNDVTDQQLIRSDEESSAMFKELQPKGKTRGLSVANTIVDYSYDDILAADYAYYVALINPIRRTFKTGNLLHAELVKILTPYAEDREKILKNIRLELEKQHEVKPVSLGVFNVVVDYIEKKSWSNLQKSMNKAKRNWSSDDSENFLLNLIGYLLHANYEKLSEHMKEMWETIKIVQPLIAEHSRSWDYKEIANEVLSKNETFRIVNDLIQTESGIHVEAEMNGHMKVFRASDIASGNRFYATLTLARKIGSEGEFCFFEVIRYFDAFKISNHEVNASVYRIWQTLQRKECSNFSDSKTFERCDCKEYESKDDSIDCQHCLHPHNFLKHFSDLDRLPCILIIVENGRMGDTFPPSFNVMDLRARHASKPKLSSLQQEIGRLCRYQNKFNYSQIPYVLIAPKLMDEFKKSLETSPDLQTSFREKNVDRYTRRSSSTKTSSGRGGLEPNRKNYDFENKTKHHNRLLLQAEPQIGKTGVFLKVISLLRQLITKEKDSEETYSDESDEDSDSEEEPSSPVELRADDWQFPHWETMAKGEPLKKEIKGSKYDRIYGPYIHKKPPRRCGNATLKNTRHTFKSRTIIPDYSKFRMFSRTEHDDCTDCLSSATTTLKEWKIWLGSNELPIKISVPRLRRFQKLFDKLNATLPAEEQESQRLGALNAQLTVTDPTISTWIFNPTYKRSGIATVNYHHSMICPETNSSCQYIQILVVRSEDFDSYCENWQTTHAILQLPETLPDCDVDVNTGGIGFARRAIQMFAEALELDYIFLLDDNIYQLSSVKFSNSSANDRRRMLELTTEGDVQFEEVSLYTALKQLESMFHCEKAPKQNFRPYKNQQDIFTCQCSSSRENLHLYTGPSETYGVLGIRKFRPNKYPIVRGFKKTHVFSFVLLNIHALQKQSILYKAWHVREDCNLNNDCDDSGLHVCKFNRFVSYKKSLMSLCSPKMYVWPDDVTLLKNNFPKAKSAAETTLHWIRLTTPPQRIEVIDQDCKVIDQDCKFRTPLQTSEIRKYLCRKLAGAEELPANRRKCYRDLKVVLDGLLKTSIGKSHLVACLSDNIKIKDIHSFFQKTKGIGKFDVHLVIFPSFLCHHIQTTRVEHFKKKLIDPLFYKQTSFDVVTSHNITEYDVPLVILYIRGNIKNPFDQRKIGNVGLFEDDKDLVIEIQEESSENGQSLRDQIEKNDSKRAGPQNEDENEDQGSPRKKMRPNSGQTSPDNLDSKSTQSTIMMPANAENGDDRGVSSIPNLMRDRLSGAQANRRKSDDKKQQLDICDLDELMIYNQRTKELRPMERGITLATHEEVVLIAKPSGSDLSAFAHEIISAEFNITRAE